MIRRSFDHGDRLHHIGLAGDHAVLAAAALDRIDDIHALGHAAHHGILPVQEIALIEHDEELAVGRVRVLAARNAHHAAIERDVRKFGAQVGAVRPTHASAGHVAAQLAEFDVASLGHETFDHAVKDDIVIPALGGDGGNLGRMFGGHIIQKVDHDGAIGLTLDLNLQAGGQRGTGQQDQCGCECVTHRRPP